MAEEVSLELRPLLAGRDIARRHPVAGQLRNQMYLVADRSTGTAMLVDPCWDIAGLLERVAAEGLELGGVLLTHAHPDHVGGNLFGIEIEGLRELIAQRQVPVWLHHDELPVLAKVAGLGPTDLDLHLTHDGDTIAVGQGSVRCLHTPGHSPGGQVFLLDHDRAVVGDTLFVGAIGRIDLPGADPAAMWASLEKLKRLPAQTRIFPGHDYGRAPSSTIGEELKTNPYLQAPNRESWLRSFG